MFEFFEKMSHAQHVADFVSEGGLASIIDFFLSADGYFAFILILPILIVGYFKTERLFWDDLDLFRLVLNRYTVIVFFALSSLYGYLLYGWGKCGLEHLAGWNFVYNWAAFVGYFPYVVLPRTWVFIVAYGFFFLILIDKQFADWSFGRKTIHLSFALRAGLLVLVSAVMIAIADTLWFFTVYLVTKLSC